MPFLENKIPPPLVTLAVAYAMNMMAHHSQALVINERFQLAAAAVFFALAFALMLAGLLGLSNAKTTFDPVRINRATALATGGIFKFTRNPIYLGDVFLLLSWAIFLGAPLALLGPPVFIAYIQHFQIKPEERVMHEKFGAAFEVYCAKTRRWI